MGTPLQRNLNLKLMKMKTQLLLALAIIISSMAFGQQAGKTGKLFSFTAAFFLKKKQPRTQPTNSTLHLGCIKSKK